MNNMPVYKQLAESIRNKILSGEYQVGSSIASEREMANNYGLNRMTVRKAINLLVEEGLLKPVQGSGTIVSSVPKNDKKMIFGQSEGMSLSTQLRQVGFKSCRKIISFKKVDLNEKLRNTFPNANKCYELIRLSYIDNDPYALQICYFPDNLFSQAERFDFANGSLYAYMDSQGHYPEKNASEMTLIKVPEQYREILNMEPNKLLFYYNYYSVDKNGEMIEYTLSYYRPEYTSFIHTEINK